MPAASQRPRLRRNPGLREAGACDGLRPVQAGRRPQRPRLPVGLTRHTEQRCRACASPASPSWRGRLARDQDRAPAAGARALRGAVAGTSVACPTASGRAARCSDMRITRNPYQRVAAGCALLALIASLTAGPPGWPRACPAHALSRPEGAPPGPGQNSQFVEAAQAAPPRRPTNGYARFSLRRHSCSRRGLRGRGLSCRRSASRDRVSSSAF